MNFGVEKGAATLAGRNPAIAVGNCGIGRTDHFAKSRRRRSASSSCGRLASLLPYVKRYRWRALSALGALILAALTTLIVPIAVRRMIDFGFTRAGHRADRQLFFGDDRRRGGARAGQRVFATTSS
jgi:hypothetical protein